MLAASAAPTLPPSREQDQGAHGAGEVLPETSQTSGFLFQELMSQGESACLQPDNTHSASYFSISAFCHCCVQMFHGTLQILWLLEQTQPGFSVCSFHDFPRTNRRQRFMLWASARGWGTRRRYSFSKKKEGGWSLLHHLIPSDADSENLPCECWAQLVMQASFCTTWEWWDLNHNKIWVHCKSHYPAGDTGQFTSHIFCCSVGPWREP